MQQGASRTRLQTTADLKGRVRPDLTAALTDSNSTPLPVSQVAPATGAAARVPRPALPVAVGCPAATRPGYPARLTRPSPSRAAGRSAPMNSRAMSLA